MVGAVAAPGLFAAVGRATGASRADDDIGERQRGKR
jgi:hypothetical protein